MSKKITYSNEELLQIMRDVYDKEGSVKSDYFKSKNNVPCYAYYVKIFKSWEKAKELAGVPKFNRKELKITKEILINKFKSVIKEMESKIPTVKELEKLKFPTQSIWIHFNSYEELLLECNLISNKTGKGKYKKDFLISEIKRFVNEFKRIPVQKDFENLEGYPSRKTFTNHFESFNKVVIEAGFTPNNADKNDIKKRYDEKFLTNLISQYIKKYEKVPTMMALSDEVGYEVKIYYKKIFGGWTNALKYMNLPLNSVIEYEDSFLEAEFNRFIKENNKIPTLHDFNNSEYPSFWCYQSRFGSWREAVRAYGYKAIYDDFNFEQIKSDLLKLCNEIYCKENRKIISTQDIRDCQYIASYSTCVKYFKENGNSIRSILKDNGFQFCDNSMGMVYVFDDGERTTSSYEFQFSKLLRDNLFEYKKDYFRDIKYKDFAKDCKNNTNCDYVINTVKGDIYIEIAGFLRDYEKNYNNDFPIKSSTRKEEYRQKLKEKENMFIQNNLNYYILFPSDFNDKDYLLNILK